MANVKSIEMVESVWHETADDQKKKSEKKEKPIQRAKKKAHEGQYQNGQLQTSQKMIRLIKKPRFCNNFQQPKNVWSGDVVYWPPWNQTET